MSTAEPSTKRALEDSEEAETSEPKRLRCTQANAKPGHVAIDLSSDDEEEVAEVEVKGDKQDEDGDDKQDDEDDEDTESEADASEEPHVRALHKLRRAAAQAMKRTNWLETPEGLAPNLIFGPKTAEMVANRVARVAKRMGKLVEKKLVEAIPAISNGEWDATDFADEMERFMKVFFSQRAVDTIWDYAKANEIIESRADVSSDVSYSM
jgi:hypothetical protein